MDNRLLLSHLYAPQVVTDPKAMSARPEELGTVLANLTYFGFAPSLDLLAKLSSLSSSTLSAYWLSILPDLRTLTGDDRNMDRFVVYKNFPEEVLEMSRAQYWISQILMYMGAPNELFTQPEKEREPLQESLRLKVLQEAPDNAYEVIFNSLKANKARWTDSQEKDALYLILNTDACVLDPSEFGFKENGILLITAQLNMNSENQKLVRIHDATDVLRLAASLSNQDIDLRGDIHLKRFKRSERRMLLSMLEGCKNLVSDMIMRPALWKRFLARLHPGDYNFPRVQEAYDNLYRGEIYSYNADVENGINRKDVAVLETVSGRPGDFMRRLHKLYSVFGDQAIDSFVSVMPQLDNAQLLKLLGYIHTVNDRKTLIYAPSGQWKKAQVRDNTKTPFSDEVILKLTNKASEVMGDRLADHYPEGVALDTEAQRIKLQTNDQKLASYGRGTAFKIPENMTFIRTASYWACSDLNNVWFDNGFMFFDEHWEAQGSCVWNNERFDDAAVFSGDPTNSKEMDGRACQMIDLYLDKLKDRGVRYALWSVLCYSNILFEDAEEVLATLQWGEKPQEGKLYEPARAQMVFPLKSKSLTSYVAYIDLWTRELVYMDADLGGVVESMKANASMLEKRMPAFQEYLTSLPSVYDLFSHVPEGNMPVVYSDAEKAIKNGQKAYVFKPENPESDFTPMDLGSVLSS